MVAIARFGVDGWLRSETRDSAQHKKHALANCFMDSPLPSDKRLEEGFIRIAMEVELATQPLFIAATTVKHDVELCQVDTMKLPLDKILQGDCLNVLPTLHSDSVDLVVTSPPYADNRRKTYGGISVAKYVEWFLPISKELMRVLKPEGSFILNIKERVVQGERHPYVLELILAMRQQGWLWTEEYIWHKKNCYPGKWPNRFRDAWERCLHFTKQREFRMFQQSVTVPMGAWADKRLKNRDLTCL